MYIKSAHICAPCPTECPQSLLLSHRCRIESRPSLGQATATTWHPPFFQPFLLPFGEQLLPRSSASPFLLPAEPPEHLRTQRPSVPRGTVGGRTSRQMALQRRLLAPPDAAGPTTIAWAAFFAGLPLQDGQGTLLGAAPQTLLGRLPSTHRRCAWTTISSSPAKEASPLREPLGWFSEASKSSISSRGDLDQSAPREGPSTKRCWMSIPTPSQLLWISCPRAGPPATPLCNHCGVVSSDGGGRWLSKGLPCQTGMSCPAGRFSAPKQAPLRSQEDCPGRVWPPGFARDHPCASGRRQAWKCWEQLWPVSAP